MKNVLWQVVNEFSFVQNSENLQMMIFIHSIKSYQQ